MSFLAICLTLPLLIFLASSWYQKAKIGLRMSFGNKKVINYHIKKLYKTTSYKTIPTFLSFSSHRLLHKRFFSFLIKALANFEKLIRFHWQAFIVYINRVYLKMLIQLFCRKLIVSNLTLAFLDHLKRSFSATRFQNLCIPAWGYTDSNKVIQSINWIRQYYWYIRTLKPFFCVEFFFSLQVFFIIYEFTINFLY